MTGSNLIVGHNVHKKYDNKLDVLDIVHSTRSVQQKKSKLRIFRDENYYTDSVSSVWLQSIKVTYDSLEILS